MATANSKAVRPEPNVSRLNTARGQGNNAQATDDPETKIVFEAFKLNDGALPDDSRIPAHYLLELGRAALDIAHGAQVVMQIMEHDDISRACVGRPALFSTVEVSYLQRLAICSLGLLGSLAEETLEDACKYNAKAKRESVNG